MRLFEITNIDTTGYDVSDDKSLSSHPEVKKLLDQGHDLEYIRTHYIIKFKAGVIPVWFDNGVPMYGFVRSTDPEFGGPDPMVAKGGADEGETPEQTAFRELEEEAGINKSVFKKIKKVYDEVLAGDLTEYRFVVYIGVTDKRPATRGSEETHDMEWYTEDQISSIRKSQQVIFKAAIQAIKK